MNKEALSVDEAMAAIAAALPSPQGNQLLPLHDALDRVLASDVVSPVDVPGHDNSAMDGWAFRADDVKQPAVRLREIGTSLAGQPFIGLVEQGQCVRIMTGAMMPRGADTVVMQESARRDQDSITILQAPSRNANVRRAGEDLQRGAVALRAGTRLHSAHLGLAASIGIASVDVRPRLRIAILSTGDELRSPGDRIDEGQIYDSNRHVLAGMLQRLGCTVHDLGIVKDDPAALDAALIQAASGADVIIASGGASAGERDFTREILAKRGKVQFWQIAMRPGRPLAFGRLDADHGNCLFFSLPGNPVAAAVTFIQFVRSALLRMMGCTDTQPPLVRARMRHPLMKKPGRTEYRRGIMQSDEHGPGVSLSGPQGSGILSSLCQANCLVVLRHDQGDVAAGEWVEVMLLDGLM